jgi:hypothetical protein
MAEWIYANTGKSDWSASQHRWYRQHPWDCPLKGSYSDVGAFPDSPHGYKLR